MSHVDDHHCAGACRPSNKQHPASYSNFETALGTCENEQQFDGLLSHTFIILGASGDLATKKIYPNIWWLFKKHLLPDKTIFIGYARTVLTVAEISERCRQYMNVRQDEETLYIQFWNLNYYIPGEYNSPADFEILNQKILTHEKGHCAHRIFYLALPSLVYECATTNIKNVCMASSGWTRLIIEKPFGRDSQSAQRLSDHLSALFTEQELYRIDHYLGKEMIQSLMTLRFGNRIFSPTWNRDNIASIQISFKEPFGTDGRNKYFDNYGIIRDIMQNHLLQILTLVAMEKPTSCHPDDIRDEKVKVLKCIKPLELKDIIIGQYTGNPSGSIDQQKGYLDDPEVPKNSTTPTFATGILHINNERWDGVPFILKCGKAMDKGKGDVRIQFKEVPGDIFDGRTRRNELVITVQPGEAVYIKLMVKSPGITFNIEETELDLLYGKRYSDVQRADAYERLILDVFGGSQMHFVRSDELKEAWRVFTPVLDQLDKEKIKPIPYLYGSRGPKEADEMTARNNFIHSNTYKLTPPYEIK